IVQLCEAVAFHDVPALRAAHPTVRWFQVVHVSGPASLQEAVEAAPHFDALLLDSKIEGGLEDGRPQLGGTGRTHDWAVSRAIVDAVDVPVILAGGLRVDNVDEAVQTARPAGVDVCSGIRHAGRVDPQRASAFVEAARAALAGTPHREPQK